MFSPPHLREIVTAVEINKDIIRTVNGRFGDFTDTLIATRVRALSQRQRPAATSRARAGSLRLDLRSLIDTWAAIAAGRSCSENSIYGRGLDHAFSH